MANSASLAIGGTILQHPNASVSLAGGALTTAALELRGGSFTQTGDTLTVTTALVQAGNTLTFGGPPMLYAIPTVTLAGTVSAGLASLAPSGNRLLHSSALTLTGNAQFDLADNALLLLSTAASLAADAATLQSYRRQAGASTGAWTGATDLTSTP